jgi:hypothetical protein
MRDDEGIMDEDRVSRERDREIFEAIVSQLEDPESVWPRRAFLVLSACIFVVCALAIAVVGGMGWPGVLAFSSTFVPGLLVARRFLRRQSARPNGRGNEAGHPVYP